MLFSEHYNVKVNADDDWFDPIMDYDTPLFIDPFLIFENKHPFFGSAHGKIIKIFESLFIKVAETNHNKKDVRYRQLLRDLEFPEAKEICLGYSSDKIEGAGSGKGYSQMILDSIYESISMGILSLNHFERIGILTEGIGADRISDMTFNLLKVEFIKYTQMVCKRHNIEMQSRNINKANYNFEFNKRESSKQYLLPKNPYRDLPVILVPKYFIRQLPTINNQDFKDYLWNISSEEIRDLFGIELKNKISKKVIVDIAKSKPDWLVSYENYKEEKESDSYNFNTDEIGAYNRYKPTKEFVHEHPLNIKSSDYEEKFYEIIGGIINSFKHFVEENDGYSLLWNEPIGKFKKHKIEKASQVLFYGITKEHCKINNIDVSKESNLGRGAVDFKFSEGYKKRVLVEVKYADNSHFRNNIDNQLPTYLKSEKIDFGYYVIICFDEKDINKIANLEKRVKRICNNNTKYDISIVKIDATYGKQSASNIKGNNNLV